jgi:hypothetical protein
MAGETKTLSDYMKEYFHKPENVGYTLSDDEMDFYTEAVEEL